MLKRLTVVLGIVVLLATFLPVFSSLAQPDRRPHENPETAESSPDWSTLLESYGTAFNLSAAGKHQGSQTTISELRKFLAPDTLQYLLENYNTLSDQLVSAHNEIEFLLNEVSALLAQDRKDKAHRLLSESVRITDDAIFLVEDIRTESNNLADMLGIFNLAESSPTRKNYDYLIQNLDQLREHINELARLHQDIENLPETISTSFYSPTLIQVFSPETAYAGLPTTISGQISSRHGNTNRTVKVLLNEVELIEERVSPQFSLEVTIPPQTPVGKQSLTVRVAPQERYSGVSQRLEVEITIPLQAEVKLPRFVLVPRPIQVSGKIFYQLISGQELPSSRHQSETVAKYVINFNDNNDRTVEIFTDDAQTAKNPIFRLTSLEVLIPQVPPNEPTVTIKVTPQERVPGLPEAPSINISGITQYASVLIPIQDVRVEVDFAKNSSQAATTADGSFTSLVKTSLASLSLFGVEELKITLTPAEPWYTPFQVTRKIIALHPLSLSLMLLVFVSFGVLINKRVKIKPAGTRERQTVSPAASRELPAISYPAKARHELTGVRGSIISAYLRGLEIIEKRTNTLMTAQITLREFLKTTALRISAAAKPFAELTALAEIVLYSAHTPEDDMTTKAANLAAEIKEALDSEAT